MPSHPCPNCDRTVPLPAATLKTALARPVTCPACGTRFTPLDESRQRARDWIRKLLAKEE